MRVWTGRIAATLVTLAAVIVLAHKIDFHAAFVVIGRARPQWIAVAALVPVSLGIVLSSARLRGIILAIEPGVRLSLACLLPMSIAASAINNLSLTPAGEAMRGVALVRRGIPAETAVSAQVFEKIIEVVGLGVMAAVMCLAWPVPASIRPTIETFAVIAGLLALGTLIVQRSPWLRLGVPADAAASPVNASLRARPMARISSRFLRGIATWRTGGTPRMWSEAIAWSVLADSSNALSMAAALTALNVPISPALCVSAVLGVRASALIVSVPGHFGVQEAGMIAALVAFGVSDETALAAALLYHLCNFLPMIATAGVIASRPMLARLVARHRPA